MSERPIDTAAIAIAHLEAYIDGGDELGDVSEEDATTALSLVQERLTQYQRALGRLHLAVAMDMRHSENAYGRADETLQELCAALDEASKVLALDAS